MFCAIHESDMYIYINYNFRIINPLFTLPVPRSKTPSISRASPIVPTAFAAAAPVTVDAALDATDDAILLVLYICIS